MAKWMIDAGHGGRDTGFISNQLIEKDIVLEITKEVKKILESNNEDVVLSRKDDTFLEVYKRAELANSYFVDYFISIHMNSSSDESIAGTEVYIFDNDGISEVIGKYVKDSLVEGLKTNDRGIHISNSTILRESNMPTIIVKCDYLSNLDVAKKLNIKTIAQCIGQALLKYIQNSNKGKCDEKNNKINGWKLCIGYFNDYVLAQDTLKELKNNGFEDAYIIPED